ncbi:fluoride efflux transporter FluC [Domibacillus enclensis]|uniref:Fluoride-specific ion channel FluC n=2 Tax=Domibacillus enclensis TaxID=1017273 RepID=A0A1N7BPF6_9BACI|nr:CrcB family protein [Domibacillus enclensis]SIR53220.1 CrcB protein [Domibacillus enclensis]
MTMVAIGGFFGAVSRFWVSNQLNKQSFPFGTLLVNILGAFFLGLLVGSDPGESEQLLFGTGFLGAFTTFSTWMFEVKNMDVKKAAAYLFVTCLFGFFGAWMALQVV